MATSVLREFRLGRKGSAVRPSAPLRLSCRTRGVCPRPPAVVILLALNASCEVSEGTRRLAVRARSARRVPQSKNPSAPLWLFRLCALGFRCCHGACPACPELLL